MSNIYWYVVDGLPEWVLDRVLQWGRKRNQLLLLEKYRRYRLLPLQPNCQTPPSLFSMFSGKAACDHKLLGFDNPVFNGSNIPEHRKAFEHWPDNINMIWDEYLDTARKVGLCHVPFVAEKNLRSHDAVIYTNGFKKKIFDPFVQELDVSGFCQFETAGYFFECCSRSNCYELLVKHGGEVLLRKLLKPDTFYEVGPTGRIHSYLGVFEIDKKYKLICLGYWQLDGRRGLPPFLGSSLSQFYRNGSLGRSLMNGGDGSAERILQRSCRLLMKRYAEDFIDVIRNPGFQLIIGYQPAFDLFLHDVVGYLDRDMSYYEVETAQLILDLVGELMCDLDRSVLKAHALSIQPSHFIVASDHGMEPIDTILYINSFLTEMGFLLLDENNQIDIGRSMCFFHPAENGLICFNKTMIELCDCTIQDIIARVVAAVFCKCSIRLSVKYMEEFEDAKHTGAYYVVTPKGVQLKANMNAGFLKQSAKTGDHTISKNDKSLEGIILDLNSSIECNHEQVETFQIRKLLQTDPLV